MIHAVRYHRTFCNAISNHDSGETLHLGHHLDSKYKYEFQFLCCDHTVCNCFLVLMVANLFHLVATYESYTFYIAIGLFNSQYHEGNSICSN